MQAEIELKLRVLPDSVDRLLRNRLINSLSISPTAREKLYSVYYDTENCNLKREDIALRLRRDDGGWVQIIKGGATAGLHRRYEWESPIANALPDLTKISDPAVVSLIDRASRREKLYPIFTPSLPVASERYTCRWRGGALSRQWEDYGRRRKHVVLGNRVGT